MSATKTLCAMGVLTLVMLLASAALAQTSDEEAEADLNVVSSEETEADLDVLSEEETEAARDFLSMSVSELGELFLSLTQDLSGPLLSQIRDEVMQAADDYEGSRVFEGSEFDGAVSWTGEVSYLPLLSYFDVTVTVYLSEFEAVETAMYLDGEATVQVAGLWNPIFHGLTSLGFPYITNFSFDGDLESTGVITDTLDVYFNIDSTQFPVQVDFIINDTDVMELLLDSL